MLLYSFAAGIHEENRLISRYGLAMQCADAEGKARHAKLIAAACQAEIRAYAAAGEKPERSEP